MCVVYTKLNLIQIHTHTQFRCIEFIKYPCLYFVCTRTVEKGHPKMVDRFRKILYAQNLKYISEAFL